MTPRNQYRIENAASAAPELFLYGEVGYDGITAAQVIKDLNALGKKKDIIVRIDSPGGNVFEGLNIHNALLRNTANILVHIDALAASIASIIAMAGVKIHMADNAMMMIHEPACGVFGTADELTKMASTLRKARENLVGIYARRTGNKDEKVAGWMRDETWFTANEALRAGMVTNITPSRVAMVAMATQGMTREDLSWRYSYRNAPARLGHAFA